MTLAAAILIVGIFSFTSVDPTLVPQSTPQSNSPVSAPGSPQSPSGQSEPQPSPPSSGQSSATKTSTAKPKATTRKKSRRGKKVAPTETGDQSTTNVSSAESAPPAGSSQPGKPQDPSVSETQKKTPPSKIVVRQGGVPEQSIQLAGGSTSGETTQRRESTHQMLATTEENLKKVASIQLSTDQQSSVSQIRQFVTQSKSALAAADFERAQTLAWKAKVLSEDLVNPKK